MIGCDNGSEASARKGVTVSPGPASSRPGSPEGTNPPYVPPGTPGVPRTLSRKPSRACDDSVPKAQHPQDVRAARPVTRSTRTDVSAGIASSRPRARSAASSASARARSAPCPARSRRRRGVVHDLEQQAELVAERPPRSCSRPALGRQSATPTAAEKARPSSAGAALRGRRDAGDVAVLAADHAERRLGELAGDGRRRIREREPERLGQQRVAREQRQPRRRRRACSAGRGARRRRRARAGRRRRARTCARARRHGRRQAGLGLAPPPRRREAGRAGSASRRTPADSAAPPRAHRAGRERSSSR